MSSLFGTDGVRGVANRDLTPELAFRIGRAHGHLLSRDGRRPRVAIGRDTRVSGQMLEAACVAGLCSSGADVILLGIMPTPGVAWLVGRLQADGGAVISASHNPVQDNGIKLLNGLGFKLSDEEEEALEAFIAQADELPRPIGADLGRVESLAEEAEDLYVEHLVRSAPSRLDGLEVVLDCAHGAAWRVAPRVFEALGARATVLSARPDGININRDCGSTHPEELLMTVRQTRARLGLAFDGDADRCLASDEEGNLVDGDPMLLLFARWLRQHGRLPGDILVTTVMANFGLEEALRREGIGMVRTPVGDRYVLAEMRRRGGTLGGEQSGHIIFLDHATTGDGVLTGVILASIVHQTAEPLSRMARAMTRMPQVLVNVPVRDKSLWDKDPQIAQAVAQGQERLRERGRILVRPSGTENLVRIMLEGPDREELDRLVGEIRQVMEERLAAP